MILLSKVRLSLSTSEMIIYSKNNDVGYLFEIVDDTTLVDDIHSKEL